MSRRQPLHPCAKCGAPIGAAKKYCSPCAAEIMHQQGLVRNKQRRERLKEQSAAHTNPTGAVT